MLRERHLVEREDTPDGVCLTTHRSLQRSMLHQLDSQLARRQFIFGSVVSMLTRAFPRKDILSKRGDASLFSIAAKYFPHILALNTVYKNSEPPIGGDLEFVRLLNAAGLYALENMVQVDGPELLETGLKVAESVYQYDPEQARMLLIVNISPLQVLCQYFGDSGRKRAYELTSRQLDLTRDQLNKIPEDKWSTANFVQLGMVLVNRGCALAQFNRMEEAGEQYDEALKMYQKAGDETTLAGRIGMTYSYQLWAAATSQRVDQARDLAERCVKVLLGAFGAENALTLQTVPRFPCLRSGMCREVSVCITKYTRHVYGSAPKDTTQSLPASTTWPCLIRILETWKLQSMFTPLAA